MSDPLARLENVAYAVGISILGLYLGAVIAYDAVRDTWRRIAEWAMPL